MQDRWKVLRQRETVAPSRSGAGFDRVVEITFETAGGNVGTVSVPRGDYNVDTAREAIDVHAEALDQVSAL